MPYIKLVITILYLSFSVGFIIFIVWAIRKHLQLKSEQNEILREIVNKIGNNKNRI